MSGKAIVVKALVLLAIGVVGCRSDTGTAPRNIEPAVAQAGYTPLALKIPTGAFTGEGSSINDAGVVAGWYRNNQTTVAVRWTSPTAFQPLGSLPGFPLTLAKGINTAGTIVGFAQNSSFSASRAFTWTAAGGMKPLNDLGGGFSLAQAINARGIAVGWAAATNGQTHAVKWSATGVITDLNPPGGTSEALAVNDSGDIAGWVFPAGGNGEHAWLWRRNGTQKDLGTLGGARSFGFGINNAVTVVGQAEQTPPKPEVGFVWTAAAGMKPIGMGPHSQATAISNRGRSVGFLIGSGVTGLTIFQGTKTVLPDLAPAKGPFSGPTAVNRCGTIVGSGASKVPTNGNPVPVIWTKTACD